jgi:hypothetical protein
MAHADRKARLDHERVAPGVSRFELGSSTVALWPNELRPFGLRFHFEEMTHRETGERLVWVRERQVVGPEIGDDGTDQVVDITPRLERTLSTNAYTYRRYALKLFGVLKNGELDAAGEERRGMLALVEISKRKSPEKRDDLELLALEREVQDRLSAGDTLTEIEIELGISHARLWRLRTEARRRNLA